MSGELERCAITCEDLIHYVKTTSAESKIIVAIDDEGLVVSDETDKILIKYDFKSRGFIQTFKDEIIKSIFKILSEYRYNVDTKENKIIVA